MRFVITIDTGNSAFEGSDGREVARILRDVATRVKGCPRIEHFQSRSIYDGNGNKVGRCEVTEGGAPPSHRCAVCGQPSDATRDVRLTPGAPHCRHCLQVTAGA